MISQQLETMKSLSIEEANNFGVDFNTYLDNFGFECHPLKIGWYNDQVSEFFKLPHHHDTLAFVIISKPSMFEKSFLPYLWNLYQDDNTLINIRDPLDKSVAHAFSNFKLKFPDLNIEVLHDFELAPSRRPKVLVQTAGHISGAVRFYQRQDVKEDPWGPEKKIFGVCLHPIYGGWFAFRGVIILKDFVCESLPKKEPK